MMPILKTQSVDLRQILYFYFWPILILIPFSLIAGALYSTFLYFMPMEWTYNFITSENYETYHGGIISISLLSLAWAKYRIIQASADKIMGTIISLYCIEIITFVFFEIIFFLYNQNYKLETENYFWMLVGPILFWFVAYCCYYFFDKKKNMINLKRVIETKLATRYWGILIVFFGFIVVYKISEYLINLYFIELTLDKDQYKNIYYLFIGASVLSIFTFKVEKLNFISSVLFALSFFPIIYIGFLNL